MEEKQNKTTLNKRTKRITGRKESETATKWKLHTRN